MDKESRMARINNKFFLDIEEISKKRKKENEGEKEISFNDYTYMITKHKLWNRIRDDLYTHKFGGIK